MRLVTVDIGGTHARFCLTELEGGEIALGQPVTLKTSDYGSLAEAWAAFAATQDAPLPRAGAIAIAAPLAAQVVRLTNNNWMIDTATLAADLGLDQLTLVNDFEAVAHGVAEAPIGAFVSLCGPLDPLSVNGTISVVGPGTGLGVAHFHRSESSVYVQATEGGHLDFAPVDEIDDAILARLRKTLGGRVSVERVASGPGIVPIYETLCSLENMAAAYADDRAIWQAALVGNDPLALAAKERFFMVLGSVAGDFALGHGASGVVIAGGLGLRLRDHFASSGFATRFCNKGRYVDLMSRIPVKLIVHPEPGLYGAAAAFVAQHGID